MFYGFLRYDKDGVLLDAEEFEDIFVLKDWSYLFEDEQVCSVDDSFVLGLNDYCWSVLRKYFPEGRFIQWENYKSLDILSVIFRIFACLAKVKEWQKDKDTACILFCCCENRTSITVPIEIKNIIKKVGEKLREMED